MSRFAACAALLIASAATATLAAAPALSQTPQKPLGQLLNVLPMPEPTRVAQVDIPPSAADGYELIDPDDYPDDGSMPAARADPDSTIEAEIARREADLAEARRQQRDKVDAVERPVTARLNEAEAARAASVRRNFDNAVEAPVTARLNEAEAARIGAGRPASPTIIDSYELELAAAARRAKADALEAPVTARLNEAEAARTDFERRRYEDERDAYERDLAWREQRAEGERIAYWQRVERERAEYRARVRACNLGDRWACTRYYGAPSYRGSYYARPYYAPPYARY